ncbi:hypothetical protein C5S36_16030 [Candidatus Methanophagaceae archaeon]|nr:hypothetical protein C5S36_16030 [Methanophagales archaeon]
MVSNERAGEGLNESFIPLAGLGFFVASLTGTFVYFKKEKE